VLLSGGGWLLLLSGGGWLVVLVESCGTDCGAKRLLVMYDFVLVVGAESGKVRVCVVHVRFVCERGAVVSFIARRGSLTEE